MQHRGAKNEDVILRLSIDEGGGFLKVSGNLVFREQTSETDHFKSSGVKRTFILAIAPIKETYNNVKLLLMHLNMVLPEDLEEIFSQDLKCFNLACGLGNHRSTYPCLYCFWVNGV